MKIVHASDLHLDSPLRGLPRYRGAPLEAFRGATRAALRKLVSLCLEEGAVLLLLAGDLVDGSGRDYKTGLFLVDELLRLRERGIKVVWVRGNHDAQSRFFGHLLLPDHVSELGLGGPETLVFEGLRLAIHGFSYRERSTRTNLVKGYPLPVSGFFNFGILHTSAEGREGHEPYSPCTLGMLRAKGYDYWALGHVHGREVLSQAPWVVFPGNLQGRSMRESGPKGATLITLTGIGIERVEHRPLDVVRFGICPVELGELDSLDQTLERAYLALRQRASLLGERCVAVRFVLRGPGGIGRLLGHAPQVRLDAFRLATLHATGHTGWLEGVWAELAGELGGYWPLDPHELVREPVTFGG
jgi:DNA repair exonuclease SbcCD nuclease subunit